MEPGLQGVLVGGRRFAARRRLVRGSQRATGQDLGYTFEPVDGATMVTESWEFLPEAAALFAERFGEDAQAQFEDRAEAARTGVTATLNAIKAAAEAG
jgi:hypothetical protein